MAPSVSASDDSSCHPGSGLGEGAFERKAADAAPLETPPDDGCVAHSRNACAQASREADLHAASPVGIRLQSRPIRQASGLVRASREALGCICCSIRMHP